MLTYVYLGLHRNYEYFLQVKYHLILIQDPRCNSEFALPWAGYEIGSYFDFSINCSLNTAVLIISF